MTLTSQGPNASNESKQFSNGVDNAIDKVTHLTPGDIPVAHALRNYLSDIKTHGKKLTGTESEEELKRSQLLRETNNKLNPILTSFGNELLSVLISWFDDPKVLCCFIQALFDMYLSENLQNFKRSFKLSETSFAKWIDNLICLTDFIIIMLTEDMKRIVLTIPDLIKEIYAAIMGAVILLIQETAFALRDSVIRMMFEWMDSIDIEGMWSKCLPFKQLLNVVKKYISDYGILAKILEVIIGFISGKAAKARVFGLTFPVNARDLEFLYWFRDLLIKLKRATLNFDVCVDYEFVPKADTTVPNLKNPRQIKHYISDIVSPDKNKVGDLNDQGGYTIAGDGTVLIDRDKVVNGDWLPRISNNFIREFVHSEYGLPYEVIDNTLTRGTSADSIQGTSINSSVPGTFSRCVDTPSAEDTLKWILNVRSRFEP